MNRYIIDEGSRSDHDCCFTHTILDTDDRQDLGPKLWSYRCVCECYSAEEAELVAAALNAFVQTGGTYGN